MGGRLYTRNKDTWNKDLVPIEILAHSLHIHTWNLIILVLSPRPGMHIQLSELLHLIGCQEGRGAYTTTQLSTQGPLLATRDPN